MTEYINYDNRHRANFLLFAGFNYYPEQGVRDFIGFFETIEEAEMCFPNLGYAWGQVVDRDTFEVVSEFSS